MQGITKTDAVEVPITLEELIAEGESDELEFKSSLRWDYDESRVNEELEKVVVKTVAAFANAQGGTLLIGVTDEGEILGLAHDYVSLDGADRDKFERHLNTLLCNQLGVSFVVTNIKIKFPNGLMILRFAKSMLHHLTFQKGF